MYTLLDKHFYLVNRKLTDFVFFWGEMDNTELLAVKKKKKISIQKLSHPVCFRQKRLWFPLAVNSPTSRTAASSTKAHIHFIYQPHFGRL